MKQPSHKQDRLKLDENIFQDLVRIYIDQHGLAPLAAKIYAYLVFDFQKQGVTFDDFVEIFSSSKSSVSSSLHHLINNGFIKDINRIDERRRYFVLNDEYMRTHFEVIIMKLEKELEITRSLKEFYENQSGNRKSNLDVYIKLLTNNITNIKESIQEIKLNEK